MAVELAGAVFGRLTVISQASPHNGNPAWACRCTCGTAVEVMQKNLRNGRSKSCGCFNREAASGRLTRHGKSRTPGYFSWRNMVGRCHNDADPAYDRYGGRGIVVCERWRQSPEAFLQDMGPPPHPRASIDRIDNDGHYEPGNCRWADAATQNRNTRSNRWLEAFGRTMVLADWSAETGIAGSTISRRIYKMGWTPERALSTPPRSNQHAHRL